MQFYFEGTYNGHDVARKMEIKGKKVLHVEIAIYRDLSRGTCYLRFVFQSWSK